MYDSHAHVAFEQFNEDRDEVIDRFRQSGGVGWIEIGTDVADSKRAIEVAEGMKQSGLTVRATAGVHPSDIFDLTDEDYAELKELASHELVCAIGEVGFDFHHQGGGVEQKNALDSFIDIAREVNKPMVFHVRDGEHGDAHNEMLGVLEGLSDSKRPTGVIHTFSGTVDQAERYLALGMYLSFSGVVTFANAGEIAEAAVLAPLNRILIETDCPFLAPDPFRGKRNEPAYVKYVAEKVAHLRNVSVEEVISATKENTETFFGIS